MTTHFFMIFFDAIAKALGFSSPVRPTKKTGESLRRERPSNSEKYDLQKTLKKITKHLHDGSNLPPTILLNHMDILERLCNKMIRKNIIVKGSIDDIDEIYIKNALIPLICADFYIFKDKATEESIYYHLDKILRLEHLVITDGIKGSFNKLTAKKYLRKYINSSFTSKLCEHKQIDREMAEFFIQKLLDFLNELNNEDNQTSKTLNEKIKDCNLQLSENNFDSSIFNMNSIAAAYTAVIILQDIDNKTGMFGHFYNTYSKLTLSTCSILNHLTYTLKSALEYDYNTIYEVEGISLGLPPPLRVDEKRIKLLENVIDCITLLFGTPTINLHNEEVDLNQLNLQLDLLSQMVFPPHVSYFCHLKNDNGYIKVEYNQSATPDKTNYIVFDVNHFSTIVELANDIDNEYYSYFYQHAPLLLILNYIKEDSPEEALDIIDSLSEVELFKYGSNKYALGVLAIGLNHNQRRATVKNISLLPQLNDTLNYQGDMLIPVFTPNHLNSWLSKNTYYKYSMFFSVNEYSKYNLYIARAIYSYNFTIARHTTPPHNQRTCALEQSVRTVNIHKVNYDSKLICHDSLERLNFICGKILIGLDKINFDDSDPVSFANDLVRNKIVTRAELNDNLIHCLKGTTLAICLLDYRSIVAYLSVPGDNVKNIIRLGEKSNIVGLLFMAYEATFA
ncbi:hypothetical protein [Aeromonas caviae]|uniref:hypothetical protein n=1 Tax=Aeromonas caviae TaxID=648 RepID=UPI001059124E|nr:hypothetical protein [Aeromonas caviae]